jgi:hypothetical protein
VDKRSKLPLGGLNGHQLLGDVIRGVQFKDGIKVAGKPEACPPEARSELAVELGRWVAFQRRYRARRACQASSG